MADERFTAITGISNYYYAFIVIVGSHCSALPLAAPKGKYNDNGDEFLDYLLSE